MSSYLALLGNPPRTVAWPDIVDLDDLEQRLSCIDCLYGNILGVNDGYVEWSPNHEPPSKSETLAWLWFIRPDFGAQIAMDATPELRNLINKKLNGQIEEWWKEMTQ